MPEAFEVSLITSCMELLSWCFFPWSWNQEFPQLLKLEDLLMAQYHWRTTDKRKRLVFVHFYDPWQSFILYRKDCKHLRHHILQNYARIAFRLLIKLTPHRIVVTVISIAFILAKGIAAYRRLASISITLDIVFGLLSLEYVCYSIVQVCLMRTVSWPGYGGLVFTIKSTVPFGDGGFIQIILVESSILRHQVRSFIDHTMQNSCRYSLYIMQLSRLAWCMAPWRSLGIFPSWSCSTQSLSGFVQLWSLSQSALLWSS